MPLKLEIEATEKLTTLDGVKCRVWKAQLAGQEVFVFVHRLAVDEKNAAAVGVLDRALQEQVPPGHFFPLHQIL